MQRLKIGKTGLRVLAIAVLLPVLSSLPALAADFTIKPRFTAATEYNDNVNETRNGKGDYLVIAKPGVTAAYDHARVKYDLSYDFEYKDYTQNNRDDEQNHYLNTNLNVEALKDLFYVDVSDVYTKKFTDATRGEVSENDTSVDTVDSNTFTLNPYFRFPLQDRTQTTFGAKYEDLWYSGEDSIDKQIYSLYWDVEHELTKRWSMSSSVQYENHEPRDSTVDGGFERYLAALGAKFVYAEGSEIDFRIGPAYTNFKDTSESSTLQFPWHFNLTHAMDQGWTAKLNSSFEYREDPNTADTRAMQDYSASVVKEYDRGSFNVALAYNVYETTNETTGDTSKWVPSAGGEHELTERLRLTYDASLELENSPNTSSRWLVANGLYYSLTERASAGLTYRFKSYDTTGSSSDYISNTVGLEFTWSY